MQPSNSKCSLDMPWRLFLVEPRQPEALASAMLRVASDGDLARRMGEQGRARVKERFSLEKMTRYYAQSYLG